MLKSKAFPVEKIYVPTKRRQTLDVEKVRQIAESMLQKGQDTPIMVREDGERLVLVEGLHRLEACRSLGELDADAGLDDRLRKDGVDRFGESLQAIDNGDENVADAPVPEFVHDSQPELGAFGVLDPQAENILVPSAWTPRAM